jgi:hypothetical protein
MDSNPALAFWLVSHALEETSDPAQVEAIVSSLILRPRRVIAAYLKLPENCVRVLRRVDAGALTRIRLPLLRKALQRSNPKLVQHLHNIGSSAIEILGTSLCDRVSPRLLVEVSEEETGLRIPYAARRLRATVDTMRRFCPKELPDRFASKAMLDRYYSQFALRVDPRELDTILQFRFDSPPVPCDDLDVIVPIQTPAELVSAAMSFSNCMASVEFCKRVADRDIYFYRTTGAWGPEEVVFAVTRDFPPAGSGREEIWVLDHAEGKHGRAARQRDLHIIKEWLRRSQGLTNSEPVARE